MDVTREPSFPESQPTGTRETQRLESEGEKRAEEGACVEEEVYAEGKARVEEEACTGGKMHAEAQVASSMMRERAQRTPTYPRPTHAPIYLHESDKLSAAGARRWDFDDIVDAVFFALTGAATLWLAVILFLRSAHFNVAAIGWLIIFWAVVAYLALPRAHQIFTWLYVPDYFIGRTRTGDGLLGDPVNMALQGDEIDIHAAMTAAGWDRADPITPRSTWRTITSWLTRTPYPEAPVSTLTLFGRQQDFAYQKSVPGKPSERHHVRFWKTPDGWVLPGGRRVDWLAAGTYDRAVGLSLLTFQVTHKIDADIDIERNYIVDDILYACPDSYLEILPDFFSSYHDKNGGGDRVVTDGNLYLVDVVDVVAGDQETASYVHAHEVDVQARRQRPTPLVLGLALVGLSLLSDLVSAYRWALNPQLLIAEVGEIEPSVLPVLLYSFLGSSMVLMVLILIAAVQMWKGHPKARIFLMSLLLVAVFQEFAAIGHAGMTNASFVSVLKVALTVLTLLTLSARACHEWLRDRKAERLAAKDQRSAG